MGAASSHDAFTGVLPATTSQRQPQPPVSGSSLKVSQDEPKLIIPASAPQELLKRIQPPAHALQEPSFVVATARESLQAEDSEDARFVIPESVRKSRVLDTFAGVCSEILPNFLFVSNFAVASDPQKLRELGITHVVNCCQELPSETDPGVEPRSQSLNPEPIAYLRLKLRDDTHEDLSWFFYQVIAFITSAQNQALPTGKVLVHCHQGISRSCAFVVAYVMYQQGQQQGSIPNFRDALATVKTQRPIVSPNTAFLCQLIEWERELRTFSTGGGSELRTQDSDGDRPLYRLAPHAKHDPETLVLKCCYAAGSQRQRVVLKDSGDQRSWLFSRGLFVFVHSPNGASASSLREIVIWKGRECEIPNGVAIARVHVEQMVRVRLGLFSGTVQDGDLAKFGVKIVEVSGEAGGQKDADPLDQFGYAEELSWLTTTTSSSTVSTPTSATIIGGTVQELPESTSALAATSISTEPPQLFVFEGIDAEGSGSWDCLTEYDSEDLTPSDAFLLVQHSTNHHFLWIGPNCSRFPVETLVKCAQVHVRTTVNNSDGDSEAAASIEMIMGGEESDALWAAFEQGY